MKKGFFWISTSTLEKMCKLPIERTGFLFKAMFAYAFEGKEPDCLSEEEMTLFEEAKEDVKYVVR